MGVGVSVNLGRSLPRRPALTWRTTPITGRFRVCPGIGAGHWSISLHTVDTGDQCQEPAPSSSCLLKPLGAMAGTVKHSGGT